MRNRIPEPQDRWLTLSKAAEQLNIHPTTLRRWADNGNIPVILTPGGHRRFALSDLARFAAGRHGLQGIQDVGEMWLNEAVTQTRRELVLHRDDNWLAVLDDEMRLRHRELGRQLMGLILRYLSAEEGEDLLRSAAEIGRQYGRIALEAPLPLSQALRASIFFRHTLVESALHLPDHSAVDAEASLRLLRRVNMLLNTVHLAIAEVYDAAFSDSLSGS